MKERERKRERERERDLHLFQPPMEYSTVQGVGLASFYDIHTSPNSAPTSFSRTSYVGCSSMPRHMLCKALTMWQNTWKGRWLVPPTCWQS